MADNIIQTAAERLRRVRDSEALSQIYGCTPSRAYRIKEADEKLVLDWFLDNPLAAAKFVPDERGGYIEFNGKVFTTESRT